MGFLDKAKAAAEQAATKAREGVGEVQAKREAHQAYSELGHETYKLIESGEITHPALVAIAEKIRSAGEATEAAPAAEPVPTGEPEAPAAPPAMPQ